MRIHTNILSLIVFFNFLTIASAHETLDKYLINASNHGKVKKVEKSLARGTNPKSINAALLIATEQKHFQIIKCLIKAHPNPQSINDALQIAVLKNHVQIVKLLIDAHANVNCGMLTAAKNGHDRIFRTLLAKQPNPAIVGDALVESAKSGHANIVLRILATNPSPYYVRLAHMNTRDRFPDMCELLEPYLDDERLDPHTVTEPVHHLELAPPPEPLALFLDKIFENSGIYTDQNGIMWTVDNYDQLGGFVMGCYGLNAASNVSSELLKPVKICISPEPIEVHYKIIKSKIEELPLKLTYLVNSRQQILADRALREQQDREYECNLAADLTYQREQERQHVELAHQQADRDRQQTEAILMSNQDTFSRLSLNTAIPLTREQRREYNAAAFERLFAKKG
ncbi:MAG: ankyrin repeat domain-containing protein [Pseudomonadota bacterium]